MLGEFWNCSCLCDLLVGAVCVRMHAGQLETSVLLEWSLVKYLIFQGGGCSITHIDSSSRDDLFLKVLRPWISLTRTWKNLGHKRYLTDGRFLESCADVAKLQRNSIKKDIQVSMIRRDMWSGQKTWHLWSETQKRYLERYPKAFMSMRICEESSPISVHA